jgi:hypothetical protein
MSIKRYVANKDTTITNAFRENLTTRAEDANMGASDVVEVFSIYAQASTSSVELSRILVEFPVDDISTDRTNGKLPASGSVSYFLKLSNAVHPFSTPKGFFLTVRPVSRSWVEGTGLDMEQYKDLGNANWLTASSGSTWTTEGGDYLSSPTYEQFFDNGTEDLEINITDLVEGWISGTIDNNGIGVQLSSSLETAETSYYTKKFFARGSEFFFKRPWIEARWNSSLKDDRENFYVSSSLIPAADNLNNLFFYNRFRGRLVNVPAVGTGSIFVSLYSGSTATGPVGSAQPLQGGASAVTGAFVSTGIYSASVAIETTSSVLFDVWHNNVSGAGYVEYFTGSAIHVFDYNGEDDYVIQDYVINITNMKPTYSPQEKNTRFRLFARSKDWQPTIYTVAVNDVEVEPIDNAYYKIFRVQDNCDVIPYGTGSDNHTLLSYDKEGNYFDLDVSLLEPGYAYGIKFVFLQEGEYREQRETFKFRVE